MKNTRLLLLLSAVLAVLSADVSAMKRKRGFEQEDSGRPTKKIKVSKSSMHEQLIIKQANNCSLTQNEQEALDSFEGSDYEDSAESDAEGLTKDQLIDQNQSVASMITMIHEVSEFVNLEEDFDFVIDRVNNIVEILSECKVDFSGEHDLYELVVGDIALLKRELAKKIIEIRETAQALVEKVNANKGLNIADVSNKNKKAAVKELHELLNKILVKVGLQAVELQIVMNTDEDEIIAAAEHEQYLQAKNYREENDALLAAQTFAQENAERERRDAKIARQYAQQNPIQQPIVNNNLDADLERAIQMSLQPQGLQAEEDREYQQAIAASLLPIEQKVIAPQNPAPAIRNNNANARPQQAQPNVNAVQNPAPARTQNNNNTTQRNNNAAPNNNKENENKDNNDSCIIS